MRILQCLLHCRRLMLKPESGYCTTRRETRGKAGSGPRSEARSEERSGTRSEERNEERSEKRSETPGEARSQEPSGACMERSTKRSEKRRGRLKHELESAFTFPCLALYFRFMKYTLHFGFELDIVFPFPFLHRPAYLDPRLLKFQDSPPTI